MTDINLLLTLKTVAVAAWLAVLFAVERTRPAAPWPDSGGPHSLWRAARNGGLWAANAALSPLVVIPVSAWAAGIDASPRPDWWSGWLGLALDLLVLDLWIYWWHRANHMIPFLWRFHEVHHLDPFLDSSSAVRFHFGEVLLSAAARVPVIVLLGMPLESVLVFEALVLMAALFHHSNLRLPALLERGLARVIVTPSIHWVHHHAVRADTDSNYATVLSVWDRLFASRSRTSRTPSMPIGVENCTEPAFYELFLRPFQKG